MDANTLNDLMAGCGQAVVTDDGWGARGIVAGVTILWTIAMVAVAYHYLDLRSKVGNDGLKPPPRRPALKAAIAIAAVNLPTVLVALLFEHRDWSVLDPTRQAWAAEFGDFLLAPVIAALCVMIWHRLYPALDRFQNRAGVVFVSAFALAVTAWFRWHEAGAYADDRYYSAGKIVHDIGPVLGFSALLAFAVVTIVAAFGGFRRQTQLLGALLFVAVGVFFALLVHDFTGLDPVFLHVPDSWDPLPHPVQPCIIGGGSEAFRHMITATPWYGG